MPTNYQNMKIPLLVKKRIDKAKGSLTYGQFLENVMSYFELTGVDPTEPNQLPPSATVIKALKEEAALLYKRMDDTIRIMRNIENTKIDNIDHNVKALIKAGIKVNDFVSDIDGPTEEEVLQVVKVNENLMQKVTDQERTITELRQKIHQGAQTSVKVEKLISTVEELLSDKILAKDINKNFVFSREHREQLLEKMKQIAYDN